MSALGFSFISNETKNIEQPAKKRNCTLRKKKNNKSKIDNLLNSLSNTTSVKDDSVKEGYGGNFIRAPSYGGNDIRAPSSNQNDDDDDDLMEDFIAIDPAEISKDMVDTEGFSQLGEVTASDYYKQYVPNYDQMLGTEQLNTNKDALMTKLNYMIHLLEEQQDEKTDNVTEELVLYLFLGVFVIFVVDSFARAGKYTR